MISESTVVAFDVSLEATVAGDEIHRWRSVSGPSVSRFGDCDDALVQISAEVPAYFSSDIICDPLTDVVEEIGMEPDF